MSGMYRRQKESADVEVDNLKSKLRSQQDAEEDSARALRRSADRVAELERQLSVVWRPSPDQGGISDVFARLKRDLAESKRSRAVTETKAATAAQFATQVRETNSFWMNQVQQMQQMLSSGPSLQRPSAYHPSTPGYYGSPYGTSFDTPSASVEGTPRPKNMQDVAPPSFLTHAAAGSIWGNPVQGPTVPPRLVTSYQPMTPAPSSGAVPPRGGVVDRQLMPPQGPPSGEGNVTRPM